RLGHPASQLNLIPNLLGMVPLMLLAPLLEELGWRGYGVDALRARLGMGATTAAFALLWALWHAPLFLINHTYQHDLWPQSPILSRNFLYQLPPRRGHRQLPLLQTPPLHSGGDPVSLHARRGRRKLRHRAVHQMPRYSRVHRCRGADRVARPEGLRGRTTEFRD